MCFFILYIFLQVYDLQYASPATVSRCGMVYVDPKNLGYDPYWQKWLNSRSSKFEKEELKQLYNKYVGPCIEMVIEGMIAGRPIEKLKTILPLTNLNMVIGFLILFWEHFFSLGIFPVFSLSAQREAGPEMFIKRKENHQKKYCWRVTFISLCVSKVRPKNTKEKWLQASVILTHILF